MPGGSGDRSELRQLQGLIVYPREGLDTELKGWLDLVDEAQAASLMKAVLALANHGGGYVLIGFGELALLAFYADESGAHRGNRAGHLSVRAWRITSAGRLHEVLREA